MNISSSVRKGILVGVILLVSLGLIVATIKGKKQDEVFQLDYTYYSQMVKQLHEDNYVGALEVSRVLENSQRSSELVNYAIAIAAANSGDIEKSLKHMQRTLDINPYKVENSTFMLHYAEVLVIADMKEDAIVVLEKCAALPIPEDNPAYQERVAELLEQLATQL